ISAAAIFDLHDPDVRIELHFTGKISLDFRVGRRQRREARCERPGGPFCGLERALRRRAEQIGGTVEPVDANEYRPRLLGAASAQDAEYALDLAAAQIGGDPKRSLETHVRRSTTRAAAAECITANDAAYEMSAPDRPTAADGRS